jgi:hypothetical protein
MAQARSCRRIQEGDVGGGAGGFTVGRCRLQDPQPAGGAWLWDPTRSLGANQKCRLAVYLGSDAFEILLLYQPAPNPPDFSGPTLVNLDRLKSHSKVLGLAFLLLPYLRFLGLDVQWQDRAMKRCWKPMKTCS